MESWVPMIKWQWTKWLCLKKYVFLIVCFLFFIIIIISLEFLHVCSSHVSVSVCCCLVVSYHVLLWMWLCPYTLGHPSCLDMGQELVSVIQTYHWQCMECKTCTVCQQPHHEDEMMFCDKCDRGYHTFCVGMDSIPTGEEIDHVFLKKNNSNNN